MNTRRRALREALVNAVAHRNYEDASRKIPFSLFPTELSLPALVIRHRP